MDTTVPPQEAHQPSFHGDGTMLFGITLVNLLLSIVTLGIYYFWGKTRVRAYTHSQMEFDGDRFAYHGTGMELLLAAIKVILLIFIGGGAVALYQTRNPGIVPALASAVVISAFLLLLTPIAIVGSRRYRLSRASWRGIRFSFEGRAREFARIFIPGALLSFLTLGLYYPFFHNTMWHYLITRTYFGSQPFAYDGRGIDQFGRYLLALLLTIPTLGIYWFWYSAWRHRYYWNHTSWGDTRLRSTIYGGPWFRLWVVNILLAAFTLGLAVPWIVVRNIRFLCNHVAVLGPLDVSVIRQQAAPAPATGEAIADFLGLDIFGLVPS